MALTSTAAPVATAPRSDKSYLFPLILVTSLFFLWGLAYGLLDVLNKHFQDAMNVTKARSTLLQAAYFGAYFLIALPAGIHPYGIRQQFNRPFPGECINRSLGSSIARGIALPCNRNFRPDIYDIALCFFQVRQCKMRQVVIVAKVFF